MQTRNLRLSDNLGNMQNSSKMDCCRFVQFCSHGTWMIFSKYARMHLLLFCVYSMSWGETCLCPLNQNAVNAMSANLRFGQFPPEYSNNIMISWLWLIYCLDTQALQYNGMAINLNTATESHVVNKMVTCVQVPCCGVHVLESDFRIACLRIWSYYSALEFVFFHLCWRMSKPGQPLSLTPSTFWPFPHWTRFFW